jgi:heptosyltransferase-2
LLGGKEDERAGEEIRMTDPIKVYNGCGKFSIQQSASVIRLSKAVITHDTGMMHIAAALGKRIVSVWGNTVPAFGMAPYYGLQRESLSQIAEVKNLWCRPCSKLGFAKCPLGHFRCMNRQDANAIASWAEKS